MSFSPYFLIFLCCVIGDGLGEGYGMLGQAGSGKLRVSAGQSKLGAKVAKK
jgi:U4/U6 small nuclear ribonucleoprotein PRP31